MNGEDTVTDATPPALLTTWLSVSQCSAWVGSLSGEDRSSASINRLKRWGIQVNYGYLLDYRANFEQAGKMRQSSDYQLEMILRAGHGVFRTEIHTEPISPYAFQDLQVFLDSVLLKSEVDFILFDITCFTKIHLLALAATLSRSLQVPMWGVVYAKPENYIALEHMPGWRDIIIVSLGDTGFLVNEAFSRGIIIPGHEGDRLIVALSEMEASGGIILIADTTGRPDLRYITESKNRKTLRWLGRAKADTWTKYIVKENSYTEIAKYVSKEVQIAKAHRAPVIIFPYGPKSVVFAVAKQLSLEYPEWSWFVYPIPLSHAVEFSEGTERLIWFFPEDTGKSGVIKIPRLL